MAPNAQLNVRPKMASVKKQFELLQQVVKTPESVGGSVRDALLSALASQGALAAFELPEIGIIGMSLNTHKAIADAELQGGYQALNTYRKAALERLRELGRGADQPGRGTIDWYKSELADKAAKLNRVANDIALMSLQLDEVLALAQHMAQEAGKDAEFYKRRAELLRKFKLA
ncbi:MULTISPECIES: hypothetical protein [Paraburkholderia]|uniref:hypothetical protein n=1 Tax=Paraburkholderia TaxID=1822464 RepID=UPI0022540DBD|nr:MULTISPECIES: hypothetical protein [Paraburkholderia]MCX4170310.1 hypothetical protein [Paraburkholderia madseniana]MDQ6458322.1 hypothetical protein [Paraburkholderia madseniana]